MSAPMSTSRGRRARRVLVVEHDPKTVLLIRAYLEREGYQVLSAGDGLSALRAIRDLGARPGRPRSHVARA